MVNIPFIGAASSLGLPHSGCRYGPLVLRRSRAFNQDLISAGLVPNWHKVVFSQPQTSKQHPIIELTHRIRDKVSAAVKPGYPFVFIGGDHACAMGVWTGVKRGLPESSLGLIWIDAHLDAHTPDTSPSGNMHGMPVAGLLGERDPILIAACGSSATIAPKHLVIIGARSYEPVEKKLLKRLGVRIYSMEEVRLRGVRRTLQSAVKYLAEQKCYRFGLSIDLDGLDPFDAPGVSTPEAGGIRGKELIQAVSVLPRLVGLEIAEFNPFRDRAAKTQRLIGALIKATLLTHSIQAKLPASN